MAIKLHNLSKWAPIAAGTLLELAGEFTRPIRLHVNAPGDTLAHLVIKVRNPEGDYVERRVFLAAFSGLQILEFTATGTVQVAFSGPDEVWYFTDDGDQIAYIRPDTPVFTKMMERRVRNPDLERMMWKLEQNARRRESMMRAEFEARIAATPGVNTETGEVDDGVPVNTAPETTDDPGTTDVPPAAGTDDTLVVAQAPKKKGQASATA